MSESIIFYSLATLITVCSIGVVSAKSPVTAVILLAFDLLFIAGVYALQGAFFIATIQAVIYTGAIATLFLFVIMHLSLNPSELRDHPRKASEQLMLIITFITTIVIGVSLFVANTPGSRLSDKLSNELSTPTGNIQAVATILSSQYIWAFGGEIILILLTTIATIVIRKKDELQNERGSHI
jgi:NADH-quinone oxidoreductase subunit J